ncbi:MAG: hypothetical protein JSU77_13355 [Fidelibacterota bacterium]|nr:MAG: hypothetical protein JSU77_13355 [Candidatus Neomarinimicrobiota bacterium]
MEKLKSVFFESITSNKIVYTLLIAMSYTAILFSLFNPILELFNKQDLIILTVYVLFFLSILIIGYIFRPPLPPPPPPTKGLFQGINQSESLLAWPRPNEMKKLCSTITDSKNKPVILVGLSGDGKSVLVNSLVKPFLLANDWHIFSFNNYDSFKANLLTDLLKEYKDIDEGQLLYANLLGIKKEDKILFVFDQFEQFLSSNLKNDIDNNEKRIWFRNFLNSSLQYPNVRHLIIVRKEWYYDLRFLAEFVPPPINTFYLKGFKIDENKGGIIVLKSNLKAVIKNRKTATLVFNDLFDHGVISPLKAQIVGLMLENIAKDEGEITREYYWQLGGIDGIIRSYFDAYLRAAPNRDIALQVMFSLSVITKMRSKLTISHISDITHNPQKDVTKCITFLVNEGLVLQSEAGRYELAHDYLAEQLHEISGTELDPVERDNIIFFRDEMQKIGEELDITKHTPDRKKIIFSDYFMIVLAITLIARLLAPVYGIDWGWFNILAQYQSKRFGFDTLYLPVFISHLAWSIYVTLLYRRLFSIIKEERISKILSKYVVLSCTLCVLAAVFIPYCWMLSIGIGGLVVGFKFYRLSKIKGLPSISIEYFKSTGGKTMLNVSVVIIIGLVTIYYINNTNISKNIFEYYQATSYFMSIVMTYYMLAVRPIHITKKATTKMLGLIDRGKVRLKRLNITINK